MSKARILYVEDDETLSQLTQESLHQHGYQVDHAAEGEAALHLLKHHSYDLIILDVMLPKLDGFGVAKNIRQRDKEVPILFLSAKSLKEDRIQGLKTGADDYITKPFSMEEVLLKIEVFLRRRRLSDHLPPDILQIGMFSFDYPNLTLTDGNAWSEILTQREADLLKYLYDHRQNVIKRADILVTLWGEDDYFLGRSLDVFISRLRKYFQPDPNVKIENVHGVGFKLKC